MTRTTVGLRRAGWLLLGASLTLICGFVVVGAVSIVEQVGRPEGDDTVASDLAFVLATLAFVLVGFLIVRQQPHNAIGWLLGVIGHLLCWLQISYGFVALAVGTDLASDRAVDMVMALTNWMWVPTIGLMAIFVVLVFPDGRLPSARWQWLSWTGAVTIIVLSLAVVFSPSAFDDTPLAGRANPLALEVPSWFDALEASVFVLFAGCMLASAVAAVGRYRRSRGVERLQMKWLVVAGAVFAGLFGLMAITGFVFSIPDNDTFGAVVQLTLPLGILAVPLAIGAAVLKHGLYEVDVVINRAVVYGTLAAFITVVYVGIVVGLGNLVGRGDEPNLALSVAATAVVAVAFQPVRTRVQRLANRLVYGERATPYEVLSEFTDRVARTFEAAELLPTMARTVAQGIGAVRVEVWLHTLSGWVREATWPTDPGEVGTRLGSLGELGADRVVQVRHGGELLGAIASSKPAGELMTPAEDRLLEDVAAQAGLVLRNVRLIEDLRGSRQRLVQTQDEERRRLERNLHDGAQQSLVAVALMLRMARARLDDDGSPGAAALDEAGDQLGLAIEELRQLARGIHPTILTERGLGPAISSLAESSAVPVLVDLRLPARPAPAVEATIYQVVAEALAAMSGTPGTTEVRISIRASAAETRLEMTGDGVADIEPATHVEHLVDRVSVLDGSLVVDRLPGGGARVACTLPSTRTPPPAVVPPRTATPLGVAQ